MSEQRTPESAYADLVVALLAARSAPATAGFDAELSRAQAEGRLDAATARTLRFWQRASVAEVVEHAVRTLPPALVAGDRADHEAQEAATAAAESWERARPLLPSATPYREPDTEVDTVHRTIVLPPDPLPSDLPPPDASPADRDHGGRADHPHAEQDGSQDPVPGAPRRRLLVAGLTVLPDPPRPEDP